MTTNTNNPADSAAHLACLNATKDTVIFLLSKTAGRAEIGLLKGQGLDTMIKNIYALYAGAHIPVSTQEEKKS